MAFAFLSSPLWLILSHAQHHRLGSRPPLTPPKAHSGTGGLFEGGGAPENAPLRPYAAEGTVTALSLASGPPSCSRDGHASPGCSRDRPLSTC